jgi:hypothetical protein
MSRIRSIKPEFPHSESIGRLSRDARLLFILLWTISDDLGRARAASRMLASLLFPYDDDAPALIDGWLCELTKNDLIILYEIDNTKYLQINKWLNHQKIDHPSPSRIPAFREDSRDFASNSRGLAPDLGPRTMDLGKKDSKPNTSYLSKKPKPKPRTSLGRDAEPTEADIDFARKAGMDLRQIAEAWPQFRDFHRMRGNVMADWQAAWRTWMRNAVKFAARDGPGHGRSNGTEGFVKSVLEDIENDRRRREEGGAEIVPMLQRER